MLCFTLSFLYMTSPRCAGYTSGSEYLPGLLDRQSFVETLAGWAKTVIVGRGRCVLFLVAGAVVY